MEFYVHNHNKKKYQRILFIHFKIKADDIVYDLVGLQPSNMMTDSKATEAKNKSKKSAE